MKEEDIRKRDLFNEYLELVSREARTFFAPADFMRIDCPACGSRRHKREFAKAGFDYVSCQECMTLFANPRPTAERLKNFYVTAPSARFWVERFFKPVAQARQEKIFRPRAEYVLQCFPGLRDKIIGDIGGGFGLFLEELRHVLPDNTFITIEPSADMAAICRDKGFRVIEDCIENTGLEDENTFFLLTSFELFEHLAEPRTFLKKVFALLKPGGYLLMTMLNGQGFDIQILWERSKSVFPPHHLNFFNPRSIKHLLSDTGFEVKEVSTPGKLDWDILEGFYRDERQEIGKFWQNVAENGTAAAREVLQEWISNFGFSSHMRVLARKS